MADLDDFFAKKDRKKSKGKKFATADEIAKKLEESGKRNEKTKKDKLQTQSSGQEVDEQGNTIQDDEWKDFEEEKKDYSGLKIQNLTLNENEDGADGLSGDEDGGMEENEAGEMVPKKKSGPWKMVEQNSAQPAPVAGPAPEPEPVAPQPSTPSKTTGSYRPPAFRNQPLASTRLRGKAIAPDVKNEDLFPSLSAAKAIDPAKKKKEETGAWGISSGGSSGRAPGGYEEVKPSRASNPGRYEPPHVRQQRLALGNKYDALSDAS